VKSFVVVLLVTASLVLASAAWSEGKKEEAATLKYWFQTQESHKDMIKDFEARNPGMHIEPTEFSSDQLNVVMRSSLAAGTGPDVMYTNLGANLMGPSIKAGLVVDLTDIADRNGWTQRLSAAGRGEATHYGKLWAIPNETEAIVMYYNKEIYQNLGVTVPTSWDGLMNICAKAGPAGYEAISYGYSKKTPTHHRVALAYEWGGGTKMVADAIFEGKTLNTPGFVSGVRTVALDLDKRYMPNALDRTDQEGEAVFLSGKGLMVHTGTWFTGDALKATNASKFGIFLPVAPGQTQPTTVGGSGSGWYASAQSKQQDACLKFLAYTVSDDCAQIWIRHGYIPSLEKFSVPSGLENPFFSQTVDLMSKYHVGYFVHHFISPATDKQLMDGYQKLLLGQLTPEQYCQKLDDEHQKAWKEGFRP
jgi:raffinose/stachyose/melibiose transport system substrate-binding protein